jgi:hypothetical protein
LVFFTGLFFSASQWLPVILPAPQFCQTGDRREVVRITGLQLVQKLPHGTRPRLCLIKLYYEIHGDATSFLMFIAQFGITGQGFVGFRDKYGLSHSQLRKRESEMFPGTLVIEVISTFLEFSKHGNSTIHEDEREECFLIVTFDFLLGLP